MRFLYSLLIYLFAFVLRLASLFNKKAKLAVEGRKTHGLEALRHFARQLARGEEVYWVHCASLGEFEQALPFLEGLKIQEPTAKIVLTFFSPSGFEAKKQFKGADLVIYMPLDFRKNARLFCEIVPFKAVFFVKYEFWFNFLAELKNRGIPVFLVSGLFRKDHYFFKWYGTWGRKQLQHFRYFFLQDETSVALLRGVGFSNCMVSGDTRFDRVEQLCKNPSILPHVEAFVAGHPTLVIGSSWLEDEEIMFKIMQALPMEWKVIIAPHEISEKRLGEITALHHRWLPNKAMVFYSALRLKDLDFKGAQVNPNTSILVLDNIGMLSTVYRFGSIAYVGGGFGAGIHNVLEPATFGIPVVFGPKFTKYIEAVGLVQAGGGCSIQSLEEAKTVFARLINAHSENGVLPNGTMARQFITNNLGATAKILAKIKGFNLN